MPNTPKLLTDLRHLLYPAFCVACNRQVYDQQLVCWRCKEQLPITGYEKLSKSPVTDIFAGRLAFESASALLFFRKDGLVQNIIHAFKYKNRKDVGLFMGQWMGEIMQSNPKFILPDAIVPLPLNKRKLAKRGYNQAALLAKGMAQQWQVPMEEVAVLRTKYNESQTRKTRIQRWVNVAEVFDLNQPNKLQGKHVLLVDDVITTGATMEACGAQLLKIEGVKLSLVSLAVASNM